jgi:hypothetical protein
MDDLDGVGDRLGPGRVPVFGMLELPVGHFAPDHARVAALAAGRQKILGDLSQ